MSGWASLFFLLLIIWIFNKIMDTETGGSILDFLFVKILLMPLIGWIILVGVLALIFG